MSSGSFKMRQGSFLLSSNAAPSLESLSASIKLYIFPPLDNNCWIFQPMMLINKCFASKAINRAPYFNALFVCQCMAFAYHAGRLEHLPFFVRHGNIHIFAALALIFWYRSVCVATGSAWSPLAFLCCHLPAFLRY